MRKFIAIILLPLMHGYCGSLAVAQSYIEKQSVSAYNLLPNPGFENGTGKWTVATECSLGTRPYGPGVRSVSCTGVSSAKTLLEQTITVSNYIPYIDDTFKSSIHIVANSSVVQVCMLFNGDEYDCKSVAESASLNSVGYKEVAAFRQLQGLSSSFTIGVRVKTTGSTSTAINADAAYVGPFKGWVGIINEPQLFSAQISSTGVITSQAGGTWLASCTNAATPVCTYVTGWFGTTTPNCWFVMDVNLYQHGSATSNTTFAGSARNSSDTTSAGARKYFCQRVPGDPKYQATTTADAYGLVRPPNDFYADVAANGTLSNVRPAGWMTSCTSGGDRVCTFGTGVFSVSPSCALTPGPTTGDIHAEFGAMPTANNVNVYTRSGGTSPSAIGFTIKCSYGSTDRDRWENTYQNVPLKKNDSGAYTPTTSNNANVSSLTVNPAFWMQIGDIVTVTGNYTMTAASAPGTTSFRVTLPVARVSNFSSDAECQGPISVRAPGGGRVVSVSGTQQCELSVYTSTGWAGSAIHSYHFSYSIR